MKINYVMAGTQMRCLGCMQVYDSNHDVCPFCGYVEETNGASLLHLAPGTLLEDRYLIGRTLGYGGFGVTYIAYDNKLERKVAIKEYLPSEYSTRRFQDPNVIIENGEKKQEQFSTGKEKFLEEGRKLAEVGNIENVVHMYDCFEANSTAYIVMEYLEGMTLAQYLDEHGILSQDEMLEIMLPLMGALSQVHELGIIHRDISPDNIFLTKDKEGKTVAKLIDFGAAKYAVVARSSKSLTVLVKKGYSPEEQYRSKGSQGTFTDVYALAAVMYKMLTGVRPPDALERRTNIETKKPDKLQKIRKLNKDVSENIENAILNGLNVKVEDRSSTVDELVGELISFERVKRRGATIGIMDPLSWPLWAKITVPVASVLAIAILVFSVNKIFTDPNVMVSLPDGMTRVPEFISSNFDNAVAKGEKVALQVVSVSDEYTPRGKSDIVLTQDLNYGSVVRENSLVSVTVSTGKQFYTLPDVKGYDLEYAMYALEAMGLEVIENEAYEAGLADNVVISQSVEPYTEVNVGESVELTVNNTSEVSKADQNYEPTGMLYEDVVKKAGVRGSQCRIVEKIFSDEYQEYEVVEEKVDEDGVSELTVAIPTREFKMPNLNYKNQDIALQLLKNIGMEGIAEVDYNDAVSENLVYSQDVEKGTMVKPGTKVTLQVSRGGKPFTMPALIGMTKEEAEQELLNLKLAVKVEYGYSTEFNEGEVYQQSADAGSDVRRGDEITIYVCSTEKLIKVENVAGKKLEEAKKILEDQKLTVQTVETYDDVVEKGRIISQLPEADTFQTEGATIVLTVSKGSNKPVEKHDNNQSYGPWSSWMASLPSGVSSKNYDIEQGVQYRSRKRETTTSTQPNLKGWTLYDQGESWGDYGPWSGWSEEQVESNDATKVQSKTQYSIKTLSTTTSTSSDTMSGWTLYDTKENWSEYGSWSEWSTTQPTASESTKVESKTQYRYRDKETKTSTDSNLSGWTKTGSKEEYTEWTAWSEWQGANDAPYQTETATDTLEVEKRTEYAYHYVICTKCNSYEPYDPEMFATDVPSGLWTCSQCGQMEPVSFTSNLDVESVWLSTPYGTSSSVKYNGHNVYEGCNYYGDRREITRYRYRTRKLQENYYYERWGSWSSWQDKSVSSNSSREVEKRTVYRYATRNKIKTYYFKKWSDWSAWEDTAYAESDSRQVRTRTVYRYATRSKQYTYFYEKWGTWSEYRETPIANSENVDVQTRVVYRYRQKK